MTASAGLALSSPAIAPYPARMILYQTALSIYSTKVRIACAVKGVAPELREPPGGYRSAQYRALVPAATIPALVDGGLTLSESDAIIEYLDETCPGPALLPTGAAGRARARMLSRLIDLRLEAALRRLFPLVGPQPLGPELLDPAEDALALVLELADAEGPFCAGATPSLPDFGLAVALVWLDALRAYAGRAAPPAGTRLRTWQDAMAAHPDVGAVLDGYPGLVRDWITMRRQA
jgi:glutathione S-transferase/maleylpyruvate isomerase